MKPMIILPPDVMSEADVKKLEENGVCAVVAKHPANVKFVDPMPAQSSRTEMEHAAVKLSRILLNGAWGHYSNSGALARREITQIYVDMLIKGTPLSIDGDIAEQEQRIITVARREELAKMAREDARAERAAKKKVKAA